MKLKDKKGDEEQKIREASRKLKYEEEKLRETENRLRQLEQIDSKIFKDNF